jgi:hypothetical protein
MAYAAVITANTITITGRRYAIVNITETEAAAGSEWSFQLPFRTATLVKYAATLTAGTGTTINPILGRAAAFVAGTQDHISTQNATAAHVHDMTRLGLTVLASQLLVGRSTCDDATADHSIDTELVFVEGIS